MHLALVYDLTCDPLPLLHSAGHSGGKGCQALVYELMTRGNLEERLALTVSGGCWGEKRPVVRSGG